MLDDDAFGHWLAGFVDGEGCFTIDTPGPAYIVCRFELSLRLDDVAILRVIVERTGLGSIRTRKDRPMAVWRISAKRDTYGLVKLLDRYPLRAKKKADYAIWREAVLLWNVAPRSELAEPLARYKAALEAVRIFDRDGIDVMPYRSSQLRLIN